MFSFISLFVYVRAKNVLCMFEVYWQHIKGHVCLLVCLCGNG
jgi:hypothetical protein